MCDACGARTGCAAIVGMREVHRCHPESALVPRHVRVTILSVLLSGGAGSRGGKQNDLRRLLCLGLGNPLRGIRFGRDPPRPGSPGSRGTVTHVFSNPILTFTIIRLHAAFNKVVSIQRLLRRSASIVYIVLTVFVCSAGCCLRCLAFSHFAPFRIQPWWWCPTRTRCW